ncbi:MAG: hypothetical protein KDD47_25565, partial [Acidobacteria bacterium]|nr:hypothetical protein [Acidobacteriota bacterium]
ETWTAWTSLLFLVVGVGAVWLGLRAFQRVSSRRWKVLLAACAPLFVLLGTWAALSSPLGSRLLAYSERQQAALFPSGLDQVRELLPLTVPELVDHLGGIVLLVLAGLGLVLGVSRRRDRRVELSALLAWLLPAAAAGCFSYRFVVFAVPPLVVL